MLIVDTNVIVAFLLTDGITREIIVKNKNVFITPEHCFKEVWVHRDRWNVHEFSDKKLKEILEKIMKYFITPIKEEHYREKTEIASKLIADKDDVHIIALSLNFDNEGIWTYNTKHFDKEEIKKSVKILTTKDVLKIYPI